MSTKAAPTLSAGRPSSSKNKTTTLASFTDTGPFKRINFDVSVEEHTRLKIYAARQGKTVKDLMTEYVRSLPEQ